MSTGISWCDETWNPIRGCSRVSEGCRNCYAETMAGRIVAMGKGKGKATPYDGLVRLTSVTQYRDGIAETVQVPRWTGVVAFDATRLAEPLRRKKPTRYFVNSMSDLFHEGLTNEQIAAVFGVMAAAPQHAFIVLTKRAKRMREWFEWVGSIAVSLVRDAMTRRVDTRYMEARMCLLALNKHDVDRDHVAYPSWPLPNVILGVSVENHAALERLDDLRACPAALRFVSAEPLLGDLGKIDLSGIGWLISGCESGRGARPCEVDWLRSLRDQCAEAQVPFFLKQARADELGYGGSEVLPVTTGIGSTRKPSGAVGRGIIELPYLDGVQYAAMPEVAK